MKFTGKAVILYNELPTDASPDDLDGLAQAEAVEIAMQRMGFEVYSRAFSMDKELTESLNQINPDFVFNLVESVSSKGQLSYLAPAFLERLGIQYTGCSARSVRLTTGKITTKRIMGRCNIPTPAWVSEKMSDGFIPDAPYIIKAIYEDASIGITGKSVLSFGCFEEMESTLSEMKAQFGKEFFAEKYIDGREFSISILGEGKNPRLLTPSEICYTGFDEKNKDKILDYSAKWDIDSFEYQNTASVPCANHEDHVDYDLLREILEIAEKCWTHFKLRGYARVDFRVDQNGRPWVLEINANPCITPGGSGFLKSAAESGMNFDDVIRQIILASWGRGDLSARTGTA